MEIKIAKSDFLKAAIAGEIVALFSLPVLKNLNFFTPFLFFGCIFFGVLDIAFAATIRRCPLFLL